MDTNSIKKFAVKARDILKAGVAQRLSALGFDTEGKTDEMPQRLSGGTLFQGALWDESFYDKWMKLYHQIERTGIKEVYEEAAYTWFNRFMAIRIMQKNGFIAPVLAYESEELRIPLIVAEARRGRLPQMLERDRLKLQSLLDDDTKEVEQFALLITSFCHFNPLLYRIFGQMADYTELLLPNNILSEGGFIDLLNHTDFISDEDYRQSELIGWLYQFYISEKKDEVFAAFKNKKKAEAEDIPAATQIFTPNWIVKYMVQNTVGRIYLDNNPYSDLKENWKYLVESSESTPEDAKLEVSDIEAMKVLDPACGSGHILVEAFDLLYQIYMEEGYSRREAVEAILTRNLFGVDIDTRARQLAMFALLMKAAQLDPYFLEAGILPQVFDMSGIPEVSMETKSILSELLITRDDNVLTELLDAFVLMQQANNLGSIMKFRISAETRDIVERRLMEYQENGELPPSVQVFLPAFRILQVLTTQYTAVVANPPYMGSGNMNAALSKYVTDNYTEGKADLCTAFVLRFAELTGKNGYYSFIIPPSWMFLSTFESLRKKIIGNQYIQSVLHLSRGVFGADFGSVVSVIKKYKNREAKGTYFRLVERTFQEFNQDHLRILFEKTLANHNFKYRFKDYNKSNVDFPNSLDGNRIFYGNISQKNFEKIPGCPIGYWVSDKQISLFKNKLMLEYANPKAGLATGNNDIFLRFWYEVSILNIGKDYKNTQETIGCTEKWFPCLSGGHNRKWADYIEYVVDWMNDGYNLKHFFGKNGKLASRPQNTNFYFQEGLTWNKISSNRFSVRHKRMGSIFDDTSRCAFVDKKKSINYLVGLLCSNISLEYLKIFNPTMSFTNGDIQRIPIIENNSKEIESLVKSNISISKQDWDIYETSWDFQENELISLAKSGLGYIDTTIDSVLVINCHFLTFLYEEYKTKWNKKFFQLHHNEEELNRQFIEIYGLQDELTPDVPLNEITILQQGEISIVDGQLKFNPDAVIKQFISYAIGCMMGRYRLDQPGLHIAYPNPLAEDIAPYIYNGKEFVIDDDGIIPLMTSKCNFTDNALNRFNNFVLQVFGEKALAQNLNFIEASIGKTLETYFVKDFWKEHCQRYSKRPIYWLFSSKKGAFQVLVYMHRMNKYTADKVRSHYLLPHIQYLLSMIAELETQAASLTTIQRKELVRLQKEVAECNEYDLYLKDVADAQIDFDLDDGVVVNYARFKNVLAPIK